MKARLVSKIQKHDWYRQGGAISVYYTWVPYGCAFELYGGFNFYVGNVNYGYFDRKKERKVCNTVVNSQLKDPKYISERLIKPWRKLKKGQEKLNRSITAELLQTLGEKELFKLHKRYFAAIKKGWKTGLVIEAFDPWGTHIVNEHLAKNKVAIEPAELAVLTGQGKLHFVQREQLDRLKIALKLKKGRLGPNEITEHARKYHWIHNSWAEVYNLDEGFFVKQIKPDLNNPHIEAEIKRLENFKAATAKKKRELAKKLPRGTLALLQLFSAMTDWRDDRKQLAMQSNETSELFIREFERRTGVERFLLTFMNPHEIKSLADIKRLRKKLIERSKGCIYYQKGERVHWFTGREAHEMHELLEKKMLESDKLAGVVASRGKATGRVKIIHTRGDFAKMNKGDILVAIMTRPEHTPIMQRAAAIVTDEGGIACHAAIVSRELGIPCIIGTQIATSVLKDGDLVEVDAEKGVVRKVT